MRRSVLALLWLLLSALPAGAETLADRAECLRQALASYLLFPVAFPSEPVDLGNGAFTLHDVALQTGDAAGPPGKILSLDVFAFDCAGFRTSGTPSAVRLRASGISVPAAVHPLAGLLPDLVGDDYFDLTLDLVYDAAALRVTVNQADLDVDGVMSLAFAADVSGVDLAGLRVTGSGLAGLGMTAALKGSLHSLTLTLWNKAGNRLLESFAKTQGRSMLEQRDLWLKQLNDMMATEGKEAAIPVLRELKVFVQDLRKLTVRLRPPDGHIEVIVLGATPEIGEQLRLLGLTVEANR